MYLRNGKGRKLKIYNFIRHTQMKRCAHAPRSLRGKDSRRNNVINKIIRKGMNKACVQPREATNDFIFLHYIASVVIGD